MTLRQCHGPFKSASSRRLLIAGFGGLLLTLINLSQPALAIDKTWIAGDGDWTTSANWDPFGEPNGSTFDVFIDDGDTAVTVTLNDAREVGELTLGADDTLMIEANGGTATLISGSFTNDGSIVLTSTGSEYAWLNMSTSTLTNSATGVLHFQSGGTTIHYFSGSLVNNGTVTVENDTNFDTTSSSYTNNGQFTVASGRTLAFAGGTLNQAAGDLYLDGTITGTTIEQNGGTLHFAPGALIQDGTFDYHGGTIDGEVDLKNSTIMIQPTATNPTTFRLTHPNTLASNVGAGHTVTLEADSETVVLTSSSSFTNDGTIVLSSIGSAYSWLNMSTSTLTNSATGVLHFQSGGTNIRYFSGSLVNDGTVTVENDTAFDTTSATYTNNGQFTVASGRTLAIYGGTLNQAAGDFYLNGTITGGTIRLSGGTFHAGANSLIQNGTFDYQSGTVDGTAKLNSSTLMVAPAATAPTAFVLTGGNTLVSNVGAGHSVTLEASDNTAVLTSNNDVTNDGTIALASTGSAYSWLNMSTSTLTNGATGLLHFQSGGTAVRYFTGDLMNNGIVTVDQQTFFDRNMGSYTNNGRINVGVDATLHIISGGTLTNFSGSTLTGGTYDLVGVFAFPGADIDTLNAEVILHGASGIVDESSADALNELSVIGAQGALRLLDGANRSRDGSLTIHGELEMGGGLYFLSNGGVENTATGTVSGVGEIRANFFTSEGTVAPGASAGNLDSAGILHIRFGYEQESTGHLSIEIFGNDNSDPMDPEYDVLQAGTASLDGTLGVSLSSFTPSPGDEFTILDAEVLSGDFDNVANGGRLDTLDGSGSFLVTYDTDLDNVVLSDFRLAADFNFDGIIDAADYVVWRKVIGTPASYDTWRTDFGRSVLGGGGGAAETRDDGAVPEPASLALLLAGLFMSWMVRRR